MKEKLHDLNTTWRDPDDAPELSTDWFKTSELRQGDKVLRKGRPKAALTKQHTTIRLSREVLDRFRSTGAGWQTRIDDALKEWLQSHQGL